MNSSTMPASRSVCKASASRAMRVLIVEPRPMSAPMLRRWLEQRGHTLDAADNAEWGFTHAVAARPDAVLIDLALGASSGSTLADRLRTR
jgi:DNA-binding response OmpR family regulator